MDSSRFIPSFGQYEFILRRLHSLLGLIPVGGFLVFHLLTNGSILDGLVTFQDRVSVIHRLGRSTLFLLEWPFIFLPILFHGIIGLAIISRGKRNVRAYPYLGNIRYTLQRGTGVVAFAFVLCHVFHMHGWLRWDWWVQSVAEPLGGSRFHPDDAFPAAEAIRASTWIPLLYAVGILASVYHLANGLWTMGITWGLWTGPRAQRWANVPCAAFGVFLAVVGLGALYGMMTVQRPAPAVPTAAHEARPGPGRAATAPTGPRDPIAGVAPGRAAPTRPGAAPPR